MGDHATVQLGVVFPQTEIGPDPSAVRAFAQILNEFRQSYVLRYSPHGVTGNGWHAVGVQVPAQPSLTVKARSGYFAR